MKRNLFAILFTVTIFGIIIYGLLNNIWVSLMILFIITILFVSISYINNYDKKENLNIIKDEEKLYFYLTDDLLFSINLASNKPIEETLREVINLEIIHMKDIIGKICFINFEDNKLLDELNSVIVQKIK